MGNKQNQTFTTIQKNMLVPNNFLNPDNEKRLKRVKELTADIEKDMNKAIDDMVWIKDNIDTYNAYLKQFAPELAQFEVLNSNGEVSEPLTVARAWVRDGMMAVGYAAGYNGGKALFNNVAKVVLLRNGNIGRAAFMRNITPSFGRAMGGGAARFLGGAGASMLIGALVDTAWEVVESQKREKELKEKIKELFPIRVDTYIKQKMLAGMKERMNGFIYMVENFKKMGMDVPKEKATALIRKDIDEWYKIQAQLTPEVAAKHWWNVDSSRHSYTTDDK